MAATLKAYKGMGMEGSTARWYDRTTRKDMPQFQALAARIAALMPARGAVLEVAPGPGFLAIELARRGLQVRGVDISETFVDLARRNAAAAAVTARGSTSPAPSTITRTAMNGRWLVRATVATARLSMSTAAAPVSR